MFVIGLLGVIFSIFFYFHKPQEEIDKRQALAEKEAQNTADVLARQVQWEKESNERRFLELSKSQSEATALAQNHIHTLDTKIDNLSAMMGEMSNRITALDTTLKIVYDTVKNK